jgi:glycosyltransferase involved in cell wall biosynthesis
VQRRRGARGVAGALRAIDRWIARRARAVIVLSEGFAALYRDDRGVPEARVHVVPNWLAPDSIRAVDPSPIRARFGVGDDDVLLVYGGTIGSSAEQLIEAFATIADPRVHLLLAGDGAAAPACERRARELDRVHVLRPWKEEDTSAVLSAADIFVLPTSGQQSVTSVPSKLIAYLLAARPVIAAVEARSDVARVLHEAEAGWVVPPDELAPAISRAASTPRQERHALGARGRAYALEHFTTDACVPRVLEILCR